MVRGVSTDYITYREIMDELVQPIPHDGLDADTLKRLYESKLVYLENIRVKCFLEINSGRVSEFTISDYELILCAVHRTQEHIRQLILQSLSAKLSKRIAS